jgi:hypothetical protein
MLIPVAEGDDFAVATAFHFISIKIFRQFPNRGASELSFRSPNARAAEKSNDTAVAVVLLITEPVEQLIDQRDASLLCAALRVGIGLGVQ